MGTTQKNIVRNNYQNNKGFKSAKTPIQFKQQKDFFKALEDNNKKKQQEKAVEEETTNPDK